MTPQIATLVFVIGILGLFWLDRDRSTRVSRALWVPVVWFLISGSRTVSQWLGTAPLQSAGQLLEGSPLDRLIFTGLIATGIFILLRRGRQLERILRANGSILLFLVYCAVSVLWSDYPFVSFKRWFKLCGDVVMVLVVLSDHDPSTSMKRLLTRVAFLLLPISILLIKYYPELGRGYHTFTFTPIVAGVTLSKNLLGSICTLYGLGCVWRFLLTLRSPEQPRRAARLTAHGAVVAMALWLLIMADSATSLICFILGTGILALATLPRFASKPATMRLLVGGTLFAGLAVFLFGADAVFIEAMGRDSSLTGRTVIWGKLVEMAPHPIVGAGFESFWLGPRLERLQSTYRWLNSAHNGYLEVFLNLGWVGLSLLVVLMVTGYRNITAAFRHEQETASIRLAYFMIVPLYAVSEAAFRMMNPIWLVFLLAITAVPKDAARPGFEESDSITRNLHPQRVVWPSLGTKGDVTWE